MERRALIALALSFLVFVVFIYYGDRFHRPLHPTPSTQTPEAPRPAPAPRCLFSMP